MPSRQPFTALCQRLSQPAKAGRADLHVHTTASDGEYRPEQIVELARRAGLAAVAITDHDTLAGLPAARAAAAGSSLEVIAGVEITCGFRDRELHLLAYFVDPADRAMNEALAVIRRDREGRFAAMIERLRECGVSVDVGRLTDRPESLGRRHLAQLLVEQGHVRTIREAFGKWLADGGRACVAKKRLPVGEVIALVRAAGGVAAWAHPAYDGSGDALAELARLGLDAVECDFPEVKASRREMLRQQARALGLEVTAGSDCHGPGKRPVGHCTISDDELGRLRRRSKG